MKKSVLLFSAISLLLTKAYAQDAPTEAIKEAPSVREVPSPDKSGTGEQKPALPLMLSFPSEPGWNVLKEGQKLAFKVNASGGTDSTFSYAITQGKIDGVAFDSLGNFAWAPSYDFVDRLSGSRFVQLLFEAKNKKGESVSHVAEFKVEHVNRPPVIGELKPFYVRPNTTNTYTIESSAIMDEDNDPIVIIPIADSMPQGAKLTAQGEFTWHPSLTQFNRLRNNPVLLEFYVEDQPTKARTKGSFTLKATQQDLPPSIQMVPSQKRFSYDEDATVNLKFQLYDPNGESDIASFNFISDNKNVPAGALVKNAPSQYEFIWTPGYDFVKDPQDSLSFNITFFVIDKSNLKEERTLSFSVLNAVNEIEKDKRLYGEYRASLVRAWDLMEQLKEAEKDLKKKYKRAKKGKKARSLTNASLGAATGVAPVVVDVPETSKKITTIGGTAVMTIGTLEATEVIGRSTKDLVERLNYIMEKRNELQTKGDIFARKYALKSSRRKPDFMKDVDEFVAVMNLKGLVALELDAGWQNKRKATDDNISKTYKDFTPDN
ncbi:hypothetical protein CLV24_12442 [Pontibacter ummariensis]|uniref:Uncharacterized protein n=1 Tax=Pontibacter ummariensis TaxID=1610492 RepID=A0A239JWB8_9BACT|nr:hypothetical protein [Pontibacter ummariensis]PRY07304.1 hypothetical protein CLV24_12442 [Pontibacter ummariensis]SNT10050.1 hypothetical protein SAMN06296052_12422 [Pontibacter ummariensis]